MKTRVKILNLLLKKKYLSGEEIAHFCNITRVGVWKHINYLINNGIKIKIYPNKGYELISIGNTILPEVILMDLNTNWLAKNVIYKEAIDSTNELAKRILDTNPQEGTLIIAEQQIRGRGRKESKWISTKNKDLLFSLILYPQIPYPYLPIFNVIGSLSVAIAIRKIFKIDVFTKWPNDVLADGKKIAGVLTEFVAEIDSIEKLILGIGVNVNSIPKIRSTTSLFLMRGEEIIRVKLLREILENLEELYELLISKKYDEIIKIWRKYSIDYKRKITIKTGRKKIKGESYGIDEYGNLIFKSGKKFKTVYPIATIKVGI
jgi:BirA family biotin operon repressor/biotin-[acetyl-CoA-carboxylase] ligase